MFAKLLVHAIALGNVFDPENYITNNIVGVKFDYNGSQLNVPYCCHHLNSSAIWQRNMSPPSETSGGNLVKI